MQMFISRANPYLTVLGLGWLVPILRIVSGENLALQLQDLWRQLGVPLVAIALFLDDSVIRLIGVCVALLDRWSTRRHVTTRRGVHPFWI